MKDTQLFRIAKNLGRMARYGLLLISVVLLVFALISGSEEAGIIKNSPNALPWVALLAATLIAGKSEIIGGFLVTGIGLFLVYFFNFSGPNFFLSTFVLTLLITLLGFLLIISGYVKKKKAIKKV